MTESQFASLAFPCVVLGITLCCFSVDERGSSCPKFYVRRDFRNSCRFELTAIVCAFCTVYCWGTMGCGAQRLQNLVVCPI